MKIVCQKCKKILGTFSSFDGLIDGHCICGEPVKYCITFTKHDIEYQTIDGYEIVWENKE